MVWFWVRRLAWFWAGVVTGSWLARAARWVTGMDGAIDLVVTVILVGVGAGVGVIWAADVKRESLRFAWSRTGLTQAGCILAAGVAGFLVARYAG